MNKIKKQRKQFWNWIGFPAIFFLLATIILTYPLVFHLKNAVLHPADPLLNAWILGWDAHILRTDPLNLYQANSFYPYTNTLAYSETLLGQALFTTPIIWLTNNPILAVNLAWITSFVMSGIGVYVLTYEYTKAILPSCIAGMIFAFNAFRFAHIFHLQILTAQWLPIFLLFLKRALEKNHWRDWLAAATSFNLQVLSCYYYGLFIILALEVFIIVWWILRRPRLKWEHLMKMGIFLLITAMIQIPLSLPYFEVSQNMGFERTLEDAVLGGADLTDFITHTPRNKLYGDLTAEFRGKGWWEHVTFPGAVPLTLVIIALATKSKQLREGKLIFAIISLTSFILSLGPMLRFNDKILFRFLPYRVFYEHVPGFRAIRQPGRLHILTMMGLGVLAGYGALKIANFFESITWRRISMTVFVILISIEVIQVPLEFTTMPLADEIPPAYKWLQEESIKGPILELPIGMDVGATESPRLYYSTYHWKQLINGYGGFIPPVYEHFLFFDHEFPTQPYPWIVGLGTRYVILHRAEYERAELSALDRRLQSFSGLKLTAEFGQDQVFQVIHPLTQKPNHPLGANWENKIRLLGLYAELATLTPDSVSKFRIFWQGLEEMEKDYTVFVHLLDENNHLITQHDGRPARGEKPTSTWRKDEVIIDPHPLKIPPHINLEKDYHLCIGFYELETMNRLSVHGDDGIIQDSALCINLLKISNAEPVLKGE
jgi:hypothetical protein